MACPADMDDTSSLKRKSEGYENKNENIPLKKNCINPSTNEQVVETIIGLSSASGTQDNKEEVKFNGIEISKLTKRQLKKYKKCLKWQEVKKEKRVKQRIKNKEKRVLAKIHSIDLGPSRKALKKLKMADSPCKISICIDLSLDHLMIDKDMAKTIKQILRVYTENRRAKAPMQLHLCDFNGRSKEEMSKHHGYEHWDINFHNESYMDVFPKESLVYLSSESNNVIAELQQDKVYIIGGLVDHNAHKGVCLKKAMEQGIGHAQLPISEYFTMKHRKVLTINQVFEILLRVSEGKTFKDALEMVLPKRVNIQPNRKTGHPDKDSAADQVISAGMMNRDKDDDAMCESVPTDGQTATTDICDPSE